MKVTAEFVKGVIERRACDRLAAYDRSGKWRFDYREGTPEDMVEAIDELVESSAGPFVVKLWKASDRTGRKALADDALSFMLQGRAQEETVNGMNGGGAGPGWREFMDLKAELIRKELREEMGDRNDDVLGKVLPLVERLVVAGMNGRAPVRPVAAVTPAPAADPAPAPDAPGDDLREVLRAVTLIYRRDRNTFNSYAPLIVSQAEALAQPAPDEPAAPDADDDGEA
jgi:hypothetical protein